VNLEMKLDSSALSPTMPVPFFPLIMKIIWFAFLLCFALIGLIAYVAWEANLEARAARNEVLMFREQQNELYAAGARPLPSLLDGVTSSAPPPPPPPPPAAQTPIIGAAPAGSPAVISPPAAKSGAATVSIKPEALPQVEPSPLPPPAAPVAPVALTAQQSQLLSLPAIAKVKEAFPNDGFVLIDSGSRKQLTAGMQFDIRRGAALIARITLTSSIEEDEAIADIQPRTLTPGVTPKAGDDIVQATSAP
jgi:hypothetical protein